MDKACLLFIDNGIGTGHYHAFMCNIDQTDMEINDFRVLL